MKMAADNYPGFTFHYQPARILSISSYTGWEKAQYTRHPKNNSPFFTLFRTQLKGFKPQQVFFSRTGSAQSQV